MPLSKLPFLISFACSSHVILTPPQPVKRVNATGLEVIMPWWPQLLNIFSTAATLFEVAVILAHAYPSYATSNRVLFSLVRVANLSDAASRIQLTPIFLLGWLLTLVGAIIRRHCYKLMGPFFTFELSVLKDHKLVTTGPYSIVRHPSYSGGLLALMGIAMTHLSEGSWFRECSGLIPETQWMLELIWVAALLFMITVTVPRMKKEDKMLQNAFGKEWDNWATMVPYRVFPGIY